MRRAPLGLRFGVFAATLGLGACGGDSSPAGTSGEAGSGGSDTSSSATSSQGGGDASVVSSSSATASATSTSTASTSTSTSASASTGSGDPDFTADGCFRWAGAATSNIELQAAVQKHVCVEVQVGTFVIASSVVMPPGHTLRGVSRDSSILKADPAWSFGCCDAMIGDTIPANPEVDPYKVSKLTLDGSGVATYNVCCRGFTAENTRMIRSRCSAVGIVGRGVVVRDNEMFDAAVPTDVPGKGKVTCATGGFGGVAEGAAIYSQGTASDYGSLIEKNTIEGSFGPALDVNGAWGGTFRNNTVAKNTAWAAVSLYGASGWRVEGNNIAHPADEPPQPYHPSCKGGPAGGRSAAIFLCQDTDAGNLVTTSNVVTGNHASSFYGILSIGADEVQPYLAPRNNTFTNNDVFGSSFGCADDFAPGQWGTDANTWTGNNCGGSPNTGPAFF